MPYTSRQGLTNLIELYSGSNTSFEVSSVAGTKTFDATIVVPTSSTLRGAIAAAYLDLFAPGVYNSDAGANWIESTQYIQFNADAGAWSNAISVLVDKFHVQGSSQISSVWLYGNTDISTLFTKGQTLRFQWLNADAHADSLYFYTPQIRLRIYQTLSGTA